MDVSLVRSRISCRSIIRIRRSALKIIDRTFSHRCLTQGRPHTRSFIRHLSSFSPSVPDDGHDPPRVNEKGSSNDLNFADLACSLSAPTDKVFEENLRPLAADISSSFLPPRQPMGSSPASLASFYQPRTPLGVSKTPRLIVSENGPQEDVLALVSHVEGGDIYIRQAVENIAARVGADVLRIDLSLAVGLHGISSPLSLKDVPTPRLPYERNPLHWSNGDPAQRASGRNLLESIGADDDDVPSELRIEAPMSVPIVTVSSIPPPEAVSTAETPGAVAEWVAFFAGLLEADTDRNRRIVLLEATSAMSSTFQIWWPSLLQAVRQRRRKPLIRRSGRQATRKTAHTLSHPTSIVLSCAPSLLASHTRARSSSISNHDLVDAAPSAARAHDRDDVPLWWSSSDPLTRAIKEEERLALLGVSDGSVGGQREWSSPHLGPAMLVPSFDEPVTNRSIHPLFAALSSHLSPRPDNKSAHTVNYHAVHVDPLVRDLQSESDFRTHSRRVMCCALMRRAVTEVGGDLADPCSPLTTEAGLNHMWDESGLQWMQALSLAARTIGEKALDLGTDQSEPAVTVTWRDIMTAQSAMAHEADLARAKTQSRTSQSPKSTLSGNDPVVEELRASQDLNKYEKRLLPCIVDPFKLAATTFDDVHLPETTIDAVRTMVSLPLLHPEAFAGGLLREHSTGGALLFGPPGTGKTLLARAVARESGARMLAIQPSDVNDMYVGEGEKLVKAVFSLARRLSPCIIFLDEVDSLFAARSSRSSSGSSTAHNQILTEFMQEMDGLSSAGLNIDKRIVIIGATNRPFDLDDAILRRLPRRLLIDLPNSTDREVILRILLRNENLGNDVDLPLLSRETDGYSGSDLKHLCVSAAVAAAKEFLKLPWRKPHQEALLSHTVAQEALSLQSLPFVNQTDSQESDGSTVRLIKAESLGDSKASSAQERRSFSTMLTSRQQQRDLERRTEGKSQSGPVRTLHRRHFQIALQEIRPSSSEEGTLPELRKWAQLYGEGGTSKGRRSGFGKSFGFGHKVTNEAQEGFGRVGRDSA